MDQNNPLAELTHKPVSYTHLDVYKRQLYQFLRDKGYNQQELDASGLFKRSPSGRILSLIHI